MSKPEDFQTILKEFPEQFKRNFPNKQNDLHKKRFSNDFPRDIWKNFYRISRERVHKDLRKNSIRIYERISEEISEES